MDSWLGAEIIMTENKPDINIEKEHMAKEAKMLAKQQELFEKQQAKITAKLEAEKEKIEQDAKKAVEKTEQLISEIIEPKTELHQLLEEPKEIPKPVNNSGVYIEWIDNRFHINGVRGISKGNKIILGSFDAISELITNLQYAQKHFTQTTMISTKKEN